MKRIAITIGVAALAFSATPVLAARPNLGCPADLSTMLRDILPSFAFDLFYGGGCA